MNYEEEDYKDARMLRILAEEKLKEKQGKPDSLMMETDAKKLVHELQVHQIELEMQNEELRHANEKAEAALKKYTLLYDFAPMGYFTLDRDGIICEVNFTGAEMLGEKRFALMDTNFNLFVSEKSRKVFNAFFSKVLARHGKETCTVVLGSDDKPLCYVYMEGVYTGDDQKCLLSILDISGFKKPDHP